MPAHDYSHDRLAVGAVVSLDSTATVAAWGHAGSCTGVSTRGDAGNSATCGVAVNDVSRYWLAVRGWMSGELFRAATVPRLSVKAQHEQPADNSKNRLHSSWLVRLGLPRKETAFLQSMIFAISFPKARQNASMKAGRERNKLVQEVGLFQWLLIVINWRSMSIQ
jgi:hypothetical protein